MRLLHSVTFDLKGFWDKRIPAYAILSHTWDEKETTFQDINDIENAKSKDCFDKVRRCCKKAAKDGYEWVWIDTCCKNLRISPLSTLFLLTKYFRH